MAVFQSYAAYYDLLYKDKDYSGEVDYVESLIKKYASVNVKKILNLGCGTGRHDKLFASKGYEMTGVDLSQEMIEIAKKNNSPDLESPSLLKREGRESSEPRFFEGDIRTFRINEKFGAVISLFHVMSYQVTNDDVCAAFKTAREHLESGGIFIFDCWYGPAVLTDRPVVRTKKIEDDNYEIIRVSEPAMDSEANTVDVNFDILVTGKQDQSLERIKESHKMRYLFYTEIEMFLEKTGLSLIGSEEWLTGKHLGYDTWNAVFAAVKE